MTPARAIPADKDIKDTPALRTTVLLDGCAKTAKGWSAKGTAKNTTKKDAEYKVMVFFTDKYSRVIDFANTTVKVGAGKSADWTAQESFKAPEGTRCVLRSVSAV